MAILRTNIIVGLSDTDAAGLLFFANQFNYAHRAYEQLMEQIGFPLRDVISGESFLLPVVHAEADFSGKLEVGDRVDIITTIARIGKTSFTLDYQLLDSSGVAVGTAQTVHVTMEKKSGGKIPIPDRLRKALEEFKSRE